MSVGTISDLALYPMAMVLKAVCTVLITDFILFTVSTDQLFPLVNKKTAISSDYVTLKPTWKISSLCDSNEWSLSLRFLRSQRARVLSAEPEAMMNSE